jgi:hypothetical protein
MYGRVPGVPGNACGTDYFWEVQKGGVVAGAAGKDFNMVAVRPHGGAIDLRVVMSLRRRCRTSTSKS